MRSTKSGHHQGSNSSVNRRQRQNHARNDKQIFQRERDSDGSPSISSRHSDHDKIDALSSQEIDVHKHYQPSDSINSHHGKGSFQKEKGTTENKPYATVASSQLIDPYGRGEIRPDVIVGPNGTIHYVQQPIDMQNRRLTPSPLTMEQRFPFYPQTTISPEVNTSYSMAGGVPSYTNLAVPGVIEPYPPGAVQGYTVTAPYSTTQNSWNPTVYMNGIPQSTTDAKQQQPSITAPLVGNSYQVIHVPVFRSKKRILVKRQTQGCMGCLNWWHTCDAGYGVCSGLNFCGCLDREEITKYYPDGRVKKRTYPPYLPCC